MDGKATPESGSTAGKQEQAVGQELGSYRILRILGEGAMGIVYLAEHVHLRRRAAIKVLRAELATSKESVERFLTEARSNALVRHPGIVDVYDCGFAGDGRMYIVMEYLEGESLESYLRRRSQCTPLQIRTVGARVADAVAAAHEEKILHRDLKPANVFLLHGHIDKVKVLDFGIAKLLDAPAGQTHLTSTGVVIGTPLYMSPEQCRGSGPVDLRSDIYSLGCILFQMACGKPPFSYPGTGEIIAAHLAESPPAPSAIGGSLDAELEGLILATLSKDPGQRPGSMRELAERLDPMKVLSLPAQAAPSGATVQPSRVVAGGTRVLQPQTGNAEGPPGQEMRPHENTEHARLPGVAHSAAGAARPKRSETPTVTRAPRSGVRTIMFVLLMVGTGVAGWWAWRARPWERYATRNAPDGKDSPVSTARPGKPAGSGVIAAQERPAALSSGVSGSRTDESPKGGTPPLEADLRGYTPLKACSCHNARRERFELLVGPLRGGNGEVEVAYAVRAERGRSFLLPQSMETAPAELLVASRTLGIGVGCADDTFVIAAGKKVTAWSIPQGAPLWTSTIFPAYPSGIPSASESGTIEFNCEPLSIWRNHVKVPRAGATPVFLAVKNGELRDQPP